MFSSLQITGLFLAFVSLAPFGTYLPGGSTCVGIGNLWTCVGEPSSRVSSVDFSHSGTTHCSCACDGSLPLSAECTNSSQVSTIQNQNLSGFRTSTVVCAVVVIECILVWAAWQVSIRLRSRSRLLAIDDIPAGEKGASPIQRRPDLVARARAAQSAAGIKVLDSNARPATGR